MMQPFARHWNNSILSFEEKKGESCSSTFISFHLIASYQDALYSCARKIKRRSEWAKKKKEKERKETDINWIKCEERKEKCYAK